MANPRNCHSLAWLASRDLAKWSGLRTGDLLARRVGLNLMEIGVYPATHYGSLHSAMLCGLSLPH